MNCSEQSEGADKRAMPPRLQDKGDAESTREAPGAGGGNSVSSGKWRRSSKDKDSSVAPEMLSLILTELQDQSLRLNDMKTNLTRKPPFHTEFDVLSMVNVIVDVVCEEAVTHVRTTVEYTDLLATVTISFFSGEVSVLLEEITDDVDFLAVKFTVNCILKCHLLSDGGVCSIVVDMDTDKITDITQLTLVARSDEATRELYQTLMALCKLGVAHLCDRLPTIAGQLTAKVGSPSTSLCDRDVSTRVSPMPKGDVGRYSNRSGADGSRSAAVRPARNRPTPR